jgi:chorismate synthase
VISLLQCVIATIYMCIPLTSCQRNEADLVQIQSGIEQGVTLGTPIGLYVQNKDQRPHDYTETDLYPRPSHADYTYLQKYGVKASSGGGRSSARETIGRVAAGAIAEKYLKEVYGVEIVAFTSSVGKVHLPSTIAPPSMAEPSAAEEDDEIGDALSAEFVKLLKTVTREQVDEAGPTRCPHPETAERMMKVNIDATIHTGCMSNNLSAYPQSKGCPGLYWRHCHLCHPQGARRTRRACLRQARGQARTRYALDSRHKGL